VLASVRSAILLGVDGQVVTVEVHVSNGLPGFTVVGLPDTAGRESRERVRAALLSAGRPWPLSRVTVNLAPAALRKPGAGLELAIALGLLVASGELPDAAIEGCGVLGELGLDGTVRPVPGTLALVDALRRAGIRRVLAPAAGAHEAALVPGVEVRVARTLGELHACLAGELPWPEVPPPAPDPAARAEPEEADLADVRGLHLAAVALGAAAAGGHHLLLVGPPGAGKTMLARRLPTILPPPDADEALEITRIRSAAGSGAERGLARDRPFRAPHHTASAPALVGGGPRARPGEITLAHRGALFLDELGEFPPAVLEALRQPLEERRIRISRAACSVEMPADFVLVACTNPCPCGLGREVCRCSDRERARYCRRLSAPLLDRFDLRLLIEPPARDDPPVEPSAEWRARVLAAVARQHERLAATPWRRNSQVPAGAIETLLPLRTGARDGGACAQGGGGVGAGCGVIDWLSGRRSLCRARLRP